MVADSKYIQHNWTVFVSQTGKEVYNLCVLLKVIPKTLVTNNYSRLDKDTVAFLKEQGVEIVEIPFRPAVQDYLQENILRSDLITLHGFLRILPADFINNYKGVIYNGHPGLITKYPELKGKDPQERAFKGSYEYIGSVVHEVTPEVDEGQVVRKVKFKNSAPNLDETFRVLKIASLIAWESFLLEELGKIKL